MTKRVALVTDGTAEAFALASWLGQHADTEILEAKSGADADRVAGLRRGTGTRVITLADGARAGDVDGEPALAWARALLAPLRTIRRRTEGPATLDAAGDLPKEVRFLLDTIAATTPLTRKRGRPRGAFRGVELDVAVAILCEPARAWTERALGTATARAPSAVHKALASFERQGYVAKVRGEIRARDPVTLRDALLDPWRGAVGLPREASGLALPPRTEVAGALRLLSRTGGPWALAGASAGAASVAVIEPATTIYAGDEVVAALLARGFGHANPNAARLRVWRPVEGAVFYRPRTIDGSPATNRVIAYLDLAISGVDRYQSAAEAVWREDD